MKYKVAKKHKTFTLEVVEALVNGEIVIVVQDIWISCIKHVGNLQADDHSSEIRSNKILTTVIPSLQDSDKEHGEIETMIITTVALFVSLISFFFCTFIKPVY
jgi:hypothetical protein